MLDNDVEGLDMTFCVDIEKFGAIETIELKEDGSNIYVTNENKKEYI